MPAHDPSERPEDEALRQKLEGLPRELAPERNLWPGIAHRIRRRQAPLVVLRRVALGGLVAAAASFAVYASRAPRHVFPVGPSPSSVAVVPALSSQSAPERLFPGEADYARAAEALLAEFENERPSLSPDTVRVFEENLAIVDRAIGTCKTALLDDPDDPELLESLDLAYEEKLELLRTAVELPTES